MSGTNDFTYEEKYKQINIDSGLTSPKKQKSEESEYEYYSHSSDSENNSVYLKSEYLLSNGFYYMEDEKDESIRKRREEGLNSHLLGYQKEIYLGVLYNDFGKLDVAGVSET